MISQLPGRDHNSGLLVFELSLTHGRASPTLTGQNHRQDFPAGPPSPSLGARLPSLAKTVLILRFKLGK